MMLRSFRLRTAALLLSCSLFSLPVFGFQDPLTRIQKAAAELKWEEAEALAERAIANSTSAEQRTRFEDIRQYVRSPAVRLRYAVAAALKDNDEARIADLVQTQRAAAAGDLHALDELDTLQIQVYAKLDRAADAYAILAQRDPETHDSERTQLLRANVALAALRTNDHDTLDKTLAMSFRDSNVYPALWRRAHTDLVFNPAGLKLPMTAGQWVLYDMALGSYHQAMHQLRYSRANHPADRVYVNLRWFDAPTPADTLQAMADQAIANYTGTYGEQELDLRLATPLPDPPFDNVFHALAAIPAGQEPDGSTSRQAVAAWVAEHHGWQISIIAIVALEDHEAQVGSLAPLLDAMAWTTPACPLPTDIAARDRELDQLWIRQDWVNIGALDDAFMGHSCFPLDVARLQSLRSLAAYHRKDWKAASALAEPTIDAWRYTPGRNGDGDLRRAMMLRAADAAYRLGQASLGQARLASYHQREFTDQLPGMQYPGWALADGQHAFVHQASGKRLPWYQHGYVLQLLGRDMATYTDLSTGAQLGITYFPKDQQPVAANVALLYNWMEQQGLHPGIAKHADVQLGGRQVEQWRIPYHRDAASRPRGPRGKGEMRFWIVPLDDGALVLRGALPSNSPAQAAALRKLVASLH